MCHATQKIPNFCHTTQNSFTQHINLIYDQKILSHKVKNCHITNKCVTLKIIFVTRYKNVFHGPFVWNKFEESQDLTKKLIEVDQIILKIRKINIWKAKKRFGCRSEIIMYTCTFERSKLSRGNWEMGTSYIIKSLQTK